jgi:hypothetical protein
MQHNRDINKAYRILVLKPHRKRSIGKARCRCEDITIDIREN